MDPDRARKIILTLGGALLALALVLFAGAVAVRDFGPSGQQAFFQSASGVLLTASFVLAAGLALALLIVVARFRKAFAPAQTAKRARRTREAPAAGEPAGHEDNPSLVLSDTAEELKTSVGAIQEELEDMIEGEVPADDAHLQGLHEETDRLKKIIGGMEALAQAQALARSLTKETVAVPTLLGQILEKARNGAEGRAVTFAFDCDPGLTMTTDPECLRRILANITDNAAKAVQASGSVTVTAARQGGQVVFTVKDTGTGIRSRHVGHVYERFFRGAGAGIGMGLTIVKELVDACGGTIEVKTAWGQGSEFIVRIPAS